MPRGWCALRWSAALVLALSALPSAASAASAFPVALHLRADGSVSFAAPFDGDLDLAFLDRVGGPSGGLALTLSVTDARVVVLRDPILQVAVPGYAWVEDADARDKQREEFPFTGTIEATPGQANSTLLLLPPRAADTIPLRLAAAGLRLLPGSRGGDSARGCAEANGTGVVDFQGRCLSPGP